jgi:hypothetical protein
MLSEMETLSHHGLTDRAETWLDFESRIWQALSCDENGEHIFPGATDQLLELAEPIGSKPAPIDLIEASVLQPASIFRTVRMLYIHALYVCRRVAVRAWASGLPCDLDNVTRTFGAQFDMGAYQNQTNFVYPSLTMK